MMIHILWILIADVMTTSVTDFYKIIVYILYIFQVVLWLTNCINVLKTITLKNENFFFKLILHHSDTCILWGPTPRYVSMWQLDRFVIETSSLYHETPYSLYKGFFLSNHELCKPVNFNQKDILGAAILNAFWLTTKKPKPKSKC